ncbi:sulfurtransferase-like selenium metabolism protein YedF [Oscillibacter hominis]|uniref:Sulfurtransferase-like selenium metabolism protein YedF n=1 Tax=Oscillibacter hominis TaxID=2763056 RepID=A0A7G9B676_9FIRM|nr:sulfurtransferase-like selenium metabolism protein YedF [Oscillibacter hominis]QNL45057.1 sulfurtransferase-like selenium metabolism protein YedF [Oscillibacter hominis]
MEKIVVNAIGEQCPIPVVKATKALKAMKEAGELEVHVDNDIAVQNLNRMAAKFGCKMRSEKQDEKHYVVTLDVVNPVAESAAEEEEIVCAPNALGAFVVAVDSSVMGRGSDELGKTLMKGFLYALSQLEQLPRTILFYNGGAHLTAEGSDSLEDLRNMEAMGVEILTCGTCANFYQLTPVVGGVTNMYTIVEKLTAAAKVVKP